MTESGVDFKALQNRSKRFFNKARVCFTEQSPCSGFVWERREEATNGGLENLISESDCFGSNFSTIYEENKAHFLTLG